MAKQAQIPMQIYVNHSSVKKSLCTHTLNPGHYATILILDFAPTFIILQSKPYFYGYCIAVLQ